MGKKERMEIDHGMIRAIGLKIIKTMASGADGERVDFCFLII